MVWGAKGSAGIGRAQASDERIARRLAQGLAHWASVDTFACYVAGPAWREGQLQTRQIHVWLKSSDRWLRRTAVVCTVALRSLVEWDRASVSAFLREHDGMLATRVVREVKSKLRTGKKS